MANPQWFDRLHRELTQRKLPPGYIERLTQELSDHIHDLMEEEQRMEAPPSLELEHRIGTPTDVADAAIAVCRPRNFWARHPVVTFVLLPIPLGAVAFLVFVMGLFWSLEGIDLVAERFFGLKDWVESGLRPLMGLPDVPWLCGFALVFLPLLGALTLFRKLALASGKDWRWLLFASVMILFIAKNAFINTEICDIPGRSKVTVGLGLSTRPFKFQGAQQLQCLATAFVGGCFTWQLARRQRRQVAI